MPQPHVTKRTATKQLPYGRRRYLLSIAERRFYEVLCEAIPASCLVFAKVRLADLVFVRREAEHEKQHFNRIQAKHIDFVLCEIATSAVRLAIELDDRSHDRPERRSRDRFVNDLLDKVGIPILHVKARQSYDAAILKTAIRKWLHS